MALNIDMMGCRHVFLLSLNVFFTFNPNSPHSAADRKSPPCSVNTVCVCVCVCVCVSVSVCVCVCARVPVRIIICRSTCPLKFQSSGQRSSLLFIEL